MANACADGVSYVDNPLARLFSVRFLVDIYTKEPANKSRVFSADSRIVSYTKDSVGNGEPFSSCLTQELAILESALRGFQKDWISTLAIFGVQPVCL
jgi:hypothetical protein